MSQTIHLMVSGVVQGVGFRAATCERAQALGVTGWVANRADGNVEVCAQGDDAALTQLQNWLTTGPPGARVDGLTPLENGISPNTDGFKIR
ncbi:acylphosphatase [Salinisphaera sp. USBA-960]|uniref:acylphosphatase n=1 Tax=Salinisphaera orenii TaxID=856731 RepID=UPI000DBE8831|nr:acylphosphatase [Salifodinibacter halophilus]NNC27243.1 acylphosphatase [Salifodinibacter halophilus]